jgi:putative flippase GtrA
MRAAAVSETNAEAVSRPARFVVVGLAATLLYAVCAATLSAGETAPMRPAAASVLAYVFAAIFSYLGHKFFTFMSGGAHRFEVPRFIALTALGLAVSYVLPVVMSESLGLPVQVPVLLTCVLIPVVNYLVLRHWVFARASVGIGADSV